MVGGDGQEFHQGVSGGVLVRLQRNSVNTQWGFRLQGGLETGTPLTIQRVFDGGVAAGRLQRGDVIVGVEGYDATTMYHWQAQEIIKGVGLQLQLDVHRNDLPMTTNIADNAHSYLNEPDLLGGGGGGGKGGGRGGCGRRGAGREALSNGGYSRGAGRKTGEPHYADSYRGEDDVTQGRGIYESGRERGGEVVRGGGGGGGGGERGGGYDVEEYWKSVEDIRRRTLSSGGKQEKSDSTSSNKQSYSGLRYAVEPGKTSYIPKRPVFSKHQQQRSLGGGADLCEPGWVPRGGSIPRPSSSNRYTPANAPRSPPVNRRQVQSGAPNHQARRASSTPPQTHGPSEPPAWLGTLRSSGGLRAWELREAQELMGGGRKRARSPPGCLPPVQARPYYPGPEGAEGGRVSPVLVHPPSDKSLRCSRHVPGGTSVSRQSNVTSSQDDVRRTLASDSSAAAVNHSQYNTPIGLYSRENARQVLQSHIEQYSSSNTWGPATPADDEEF